MDTQRARDLAERAAYLRGRMNDDKHELALIADELYANGEQCVTWVDSGKRYTVDVIRRRTRKFDRDKLRIAAPEVEREFSNWVLDEAKLKVAIAEGLIPGWERYTYDVEGTPYTKFTTRKELADDAGETGGNGESK